MNVGLKVLWAEEVAVSRWAVLNQLQEPRWFREPVCSCSQSTQLFSFKRTGSGGGWVERAQSQVIPLQTPVLPPFPSAVPRGAFLTNHKRVFALQTSHIPHRPRGTVSGSSPGSVFL